MKRDMDLIRLLLVEVEGETKPDLSGYTEEQQVYHAVLLVEAGFVHGTVFSDENGDPVGSRIGRLTYAGHDFLDAVRDATIWNKAKAVLKNSAAAATADVVKDTCKMLLTAAVQAAMEKAMRG